MVVAGPPPRPYCAALLLAPLRPPLPRAARLQVPQQAAAEGKAGDKVAEGEAAAANGDVPAEAAAAGEGEAEEEAAAEVAAS